MSEHAQTPFDAALEALPAKRRLFVLAYLDCLNATEAASRAGYANPNVQGSRLLVNVSIRGAVNLGMQLRAMPRDEVLQRLALLASASLEDFVTLEAEPSGDDSAYPAPIVEGDDDAPTERTAHPGLWRLDLAKAKRRGVMGALKKLKWGEHGPEIELHSPESALALLAKHHGLVIDRSRAEPTPPVDWSQVPEEMQIGFLEGRITLADVIKHLQSR